MERFDPRRIPEEWTTDDAALLQAVDDATATPIHIAFKLAPEWAEGVHAVIDELESVTTIRPQVVVELIEHMLGRLDRVDLDDSDGWLAQFCERLAPRHAEAAAAAGLDGDEVARRVARLESLELEPFAGLTDLD